MVKTRKVGCIAHDLGWGRILGLINNVQNAELTGLGVGAPDWKHEAAIKCSIVHSAWDTACSNLTSPHVQRRARLQCPDPHLLPSPHTTRFLAPREIANRLLKLTFD
jgi:hypothetical protein